MKKIILMLSAILIMSSFAFAVPESESLYYNNTRHFLMSYPLECLIATKAIQKPSHSIFSDDRTRGYVATWELSDEGYFYLTEIFISGSDAKLKDIFPDCKGDKVFADWFTGYLVFPVGEMNFDDILPHFNLYHLIQIISGKKHDEFELSRDEYMKFRIKQFNKYKETEEYRMEMDYFKAHIENGTYSQEELDNYMFCVDIIYPSLYVDKDN